MPLNSPTNRKISASDGVAVGEAAYLGANVSKGVEGTAGANERNIIFVRGVQVGTEAKSAVGKDRKTDGKTKTVDPPPNKATKGPEKSGPGPDPAKLEAQPEPQLNPQPLPPERGNNE